MERDHSICIDKNGKAYVFGDGYYGECSNGKSGFDNTISTPYCVILDVVHGMACWSKGNLQKRYRLYFLL